MKEERKPFEYKKLVIGDKIGKYLYYEKGTDCCTYNFQANIHTYLIACNNLMESEIDAMVNGKMTIGLYVPHQAIIFIIVFCHSKENDEEVKLYGDATYSIHRVHPDFRTLPPNDEVFTLLKIILVESTNDEIKGLRTVALDRFFTRSLCDAIRMQYKIAYDEDKYNSYCERIELALPSAIEMLPLCQNICVIPEVNYPRLKSWASR